MKKFLLVFTIAILTGLFGTNFDSAFAQTPNAPPPNFKVAFIGDQGLNGESEAVLQLIAIEDTDMVLHQGDFDYADNSTAWDNQINTFLPGIPYFASVGNHDVAQWPAYQQKLQNRLANIPGAVCTGDLGVQSSCHYQGLFFILSGVGTMGSGHESYIQNELAADNSIWSICSWHKNQNAMQVGSKSNEVGWGAYEACRQGGAIIATAHEHSYERTKTLISTQSQTVDPAWTNPNEVSVSEGSTFAFVSGLGGQSIRNQDRCTPTSYPYGCNGEWANIYTSNQGAQSGALFCEFNVDGQENKASCYFKNISGQIIDSFNITSFMGVEIPQEPPVAYNQSVSTFEDNSIDIPLSATDANGDPLTYSIISGPQNGSLSGTGQTQTYTPNPNYEGPDNFTFKANDGTADSNIATVSITVNLIPISGIIDVRINSSTDDAEEPAGSAMYLTSTDLELVDDPTNRPDQTVGLRFTDIEVPQGATITSAYIQFETDETDDIPTSLTLRAQDSDDSSTFSSSTNNITNRPTTSSSVSWNNISPWNTVNEKHNTPDISSLVQQVVDRPGWSIGNNIAFIITGDGERTAEAYDGEPAAAPLLHVEFDNSATNNSPTTTQIGDYIVFEDAFNTVITLTNHFDDAEDGPTGLTYSVFANDNTGLVGTSISGDSLTLSYVPDASGESNITIRATDSGSLTVDDTFKVTVNPVNDAPTADAGLDKNIDEGDNVTLDGSGTDVDGTIDTYSWSQTAGTTVSFDTTAQSPSFSAPEVATDETLTFELVVTDDLGATSLADSVDINVSDVPEPNNPPTADAGPDQSSFEFYLVNLDGSGSSDSDGTISYAWTQTSGPGVTLSDETSTTPSFTAPEFKGKKAKTLVFALTVTDDDGASSTDTVDIIVGKAPEPNNSPTADPGGPYSGTVEVEITFDGSGSSDDGTITNYDWDFGDESAGSGISSSHTYASPGTFDVTLTVTDDNGEQDSQTTTITVSEPSSITIDSVSPNQVPKRTTGMIITITGSGFDNTATVSFENGSGITPEITGTTFVDATTITITVEATSKGKMDSWDLRVTQGSDSAVLTNAITITK